MEGIIDCIRSKYSIINSYNVDFIYNDEARLFGIGQTNLLELIFSIPIITWVNFLILELVKQKRIGITK